MIGVSVKGKLIDLYPDTSISFELNSPLFLGDQIKAIAGSYSFPFSVPLTDRNRQIFDFPDVIENANTLMSEEIAQVYFEDKYLFPGKAYISSATETRAEMYVVVEGLQALKDKKLNELKMGGQRFIGTQITAPDMVTHMKQTATSPLDYDYIFFPVICSNFWDEETDPSGGAGSGEFNSDYSNNYNVSTQQFVESAQSLNAMPFIRVEYLLNQIFEENELILRNEWQLTDELKSLCIYNNFSIYGSSSLNPFIELINHVDDTKIADFVKNIAALFCLGVLRNEFSNEVKIIFLKDLLIRATEHNWTTKAVKSYVRQSLQYDLFGVFCFPEDSAFELEEHPNAIEVQFYSDFDLIGNTDTYYITTSHEYAIGLRLALRAFQCVDSGLNNDEYVSDLAPTYHKETVSSMMDCPWIKNPGTHRPSDMVNEFPKKMFFYRGMQTNGLGQQYPHASCKNYIMESDSELKVGDCTLYWDGEDGLFNKFWRDWYTFLENSSEVTRDLCLNIDDIIGFNFEDKVRIENMDYFVKKLKIKLTNQGLETSKATLISIT